MIPVVIDLHRAAILNTDDFQPVNLQQGVSITTFSFLLEQLQMEETVSTDCFLVREYGGLISTVSKYIKKIMKFSTN